MKLYTYFRSSAAYRVRIALNLKGLPYDAVPVHLVRDGGEHLASPYQNVNPERLVPALDTGDTDASIALTQSLAIIEYLDEAHPGTPLLPRRAIDRAYVRALALSIACDLHPINNLRVLRYLTGTLGVSEADKDAWYKHWCLQGLQAFETQLLRQGRHGRFCHGDSPTLADCVLIPQMYNARRFNVDLSTTPTLVGIDERCMQIEAFRLAAPESQPDAA